MSADLTPNGRLALAAISYVLDRACIHRREIDKQEQQDQDTGDARPRDPGLGYYLAPHTEAWARLVRAEAALLGESERARAQYRGDCWEGRGDPEAPYRGLDEPDELEWSKPVHGYRWAADRYMLLRQDAPRPPKARGHHWILAPPEDGVEVLVPRRAECTVEPPQGYTRPIDELGRRLDAVLAASTEPELLWSGPRGEGGHPVLAAFRPDAEWPFVVCMPRKEDP